MRPLAVHSASLTRHSVAAETRGRIIPIGLSPKLAVSTELPRSDRTTIGRDTITPEAFEHGGKPVGVFTTAGSCVAFAISALE